MVPLCHSGWWGRGTVAALAPVRAHEGTETGPAARAGAGRKALFGRKRSARQRGRQSGADGMTVRGMMRMAAMGGLVALLSACGGIGSGDSGLFGRRSPGAMDARTAESRAAAQDQQAKLAAASPAKKRSTIWDLFSNNQDPNNTVEVNKYLWQASLEVLNFLPIQSVDPFSGVIVTGYGTPPGGGRAYRATIYVQDPALDARSLKVSLSSQAGPVPTETVRAVEDAILTRARQLRVRDGKL